MPRFSSSTTPTRSLVSPGLVLPVACGFARAMMASFGERTGCALHSLLGMILDAGHEKVAGAHSRFHAHSRHFPNSPILPSYAVLVPLRIHAACSATLSIRERRTLRKQQ